MTITVDPVAGGSVQANPSAPYYYNDVVTLTVIANTGYTFSGWNGDFTGDINPTTITMNRNRAVTVIFIESLPPTVTLNSPVNDSTVTSSSLNLMLPQRIIFY